MVVRVGSAAPAILGSSLLKVPETGQLQPGLIEDFAAAGDNRSQLHREIDTECAVAVENNIGTAQQAGTGTAARGIDRNLGRPGQQGQTAGHEPGRCI